MYNHRKHPENKRDFNVGARGAKTNRGNALWNVDPVPGKARDEKPPNSMVHDGKTVTVRPLSKDESRREMHLLASATARARRENIKIRFIPNPSEDYNSRGGKSLSPSPKPAWNAGPGRNPSSQPPRRSARLAAKPPSEGKK